MIGKNNVSVEQLFNLQKKNQLDLLSKKAYGDVKTTDLPADDTSLSSYHLLHLMSEIGEILEADKRWKNFRNTKYDKEAKVSEIADCFIVLMNIAMYSGIDADLLTESVLNKINEISERISKI